MNYSYLTPPSKVKHIRLPCILLIIQKNISTRNMEHNINAEFLENYPIHSIKSNKSTNLKITSAKSHHT